MTDKLQEIEVLFSVFHDFEITMLTYNDNRHNLTIQIPWEQLWDDLICYIIIGLTDCELIKCDYAKAKRWIDRSSIDKTTSDPKVISEIGLEVQCHEFYPPNKFKFICNNSKKYSGGELIFTASNYKIFNKEGV